MPAPPPSRRIALRAAILGGASAAVLTGCGIRLEDDAPAVPLIPVRTPMPQEQRLVQLLHLTQALGAVVATSMAPGVARQAAVLDSALRRGGVPQDLLASSAPTTGSSTQSTAPSISSAPPRESSTGTASTSSGSTSAGNTTAGESTSSAGNGSPATAATASAGTSDTSVTNLARLARETALAALPGVSADLRPTLASLIAAWGGVAGRERSGPALTAGSLAAAPAETLLTVTRQAAYGLEVCAARSTESTRLKAIASLEVVRRWVVELEAMAGADAAPTPTAYALPLTVHDDSTARRLIRHLTSGLVTACGSILPAATSTSSGAAAAAGWLDVLTGLDASWGGPWAPFPGLA